MLVPPGGKDSSSGSVELQHVGAGNVVLEEAAVLKGRELPFIAVTASDEYQSDAGPEDFEPVVGGAFGAAVDVDEESEAAGSTDEIDPEGCVEADGSSEEGLNCSGLPAQLGFCTDKFWGAGAWNTSSVGEEQSADPSDFELQQRHTCWT
ncbi:MAG: hypothetical protein Q9204_008464 [Flavoplaca sp. TL-2023a]